MNWPELIIIVHHASGLLYMEIVTCVVMVVVKGCFGFRFIFRERVRVLINHSQFFS